MVNIGIDLGGSHVSIGIVNTEGKILEQYEKDFTKEEKKNLLDVAIDFIVQTVEKIKINYQISRMGLGMAGTIRNGVILKAVNLNVENFDMKKVLEAKTGLEVIVKNDAKCAAIAEYELGDLKNYNNILFLTLGTGIGGSHIYKGKLMEGCNFDGYEFGHMIIKEGGIPCKCGKKGCFEKYGSILAFKTKVIERLNLPYNISGPELRANMKPKMDELEDIISEYIYYVAVGLSNLINIFEPDCIVIGGGFARFDYMLLERLKTELLNSELLINKRDDIEIRVAKLGNDAGVIGASYLK